MDAINNRSVNEAALRQLEKELDQLDKAMTRMRDEKYGKCMACGDDIPPGRLMEARRDEVCGAPEPVTFVS